MRAGGLRYRLEIQKPVYTTSASGAEKVEYEPTNVIHAERVSPSGYRKDEVGEHFADYSVKFNVRSVFHVEENWRVKQIDGYLYTVVAIVPNLFKQFNTLICERVNE